MKEGVYISLNGNLFVMQMEGRFPDCYWYYGSNGKIMFTMNNTNIFEDDMEWIGVL